MMIALSFGRGRRAVPAGTLRSQSAAIGTELLARREKIERTRHGSKCKRSPVPMARAHRTPRAQFAHFPGECLNPETRWRSGLDSNQR